MIFTGFGHKPDELGGYSKDVLAKLIAFAVETIPQFGATKIISGLSLGWEQAMAMAAIELGLPLVVNPDTILQIVSYYDNHALPPVNRR